MKRLGIACFLVLSLAGCNFGAGGSGAAIPQRPGPNAARDAKIPEIVSRHGVAALQLTAALDPSNNLPTFVYKDDYDVTPTIRVNPGDSIVVDLSDELPGPLGMAADVNLHFHGLGSSPKAPGDDVLTMLAHPGQSLHYVVKVPLNQPPGLYWYHTHVHGETNYQVGQGGMSGAIVVNGIAKHLPALAKMPENILIVRELGSGAGDVARGPVAHSRCAHPSPGDVLTVNRVYQPTIHIDPGQPEFFRIINASGHRTLDLSLDGIPMQIVAIDGYPLDTYPGEPATVTVSHFTLPPAGRVEFVATGNKGSALRTSCFDSGPTGDAQPAALIAYLRPEKTANARAGAPALQDLRVGAPLPRVGPASALPPPAAKRTVVFSENASGTEFYINGKAFEPSDPPMFVVHTGTVELWNIENASSEIHDFHLHQVHFLVTARNGIPIAHPVWSDTFVVPFRIKRPDGTWRNGSITAIADFRSPIIKGTFIFHCHILDHEDRGMMAKIEAL